PHAQPRRADWDGMSIATQYPLAGPQETTAEHVAVPCAARPSTGFVHLDGPCHCFAGGPAPEFAPLRPDQRAS
ncbi:MAG TPA: hypothetical protein VN257_04350, partial [Actinotalea sp.]|nr:hypothetical protein [Actinotalea sp.]